MTVAEDAIGLTIIIAQYLTCSVFLLFLIHKLLMLTYYPFVTRRDPVAGKLPDDRPFVTVQLPCFNEAAVIRRVIDASCSMKWPRDRFEVHILDDSNDVTTAISEEASAYWRSRGTECRVIRRPVRTGYKAGALQYDIDNEVHPDSKFFPVFDADFCPAPEWLETIMPYFFDEEGNDLENLSMVQGRWAYLNADLNIITRIQELILSGHFFIEQVFRSRTGRPWNFNGTAGVWRRAAIAAVGGWEHDTIVEDSDLSIKCFDAGFRGVYVRDITAPSELPTAISDYRSQQTRWIKGFGQLFAKRAGMALTSRNTNLVHKAEFLFHTLPSLCYGATVLFQLYFPLAIFVNTNFSWPWLGVNLGALAIFWAFYSLTLYRMLGFWKGLANQWRIAGIMVLCWGLSPLLAYAFIEGMISHDATFTRTPKRAATASVTMTDSMSTNVTTTSRSASNDSDAEDGVTARQAATPPHADSSKPSPQTSEHSSSSAVGEMASVSGATTLTAMTSSLTSDGESSSALSKTPQEAKASRASYFTTKITFLPFFEFAVAVWSLFAAVAAIFGLAGAPIHENFNRGILWLTAVVIFSTGCGVGLLWSSLGAIGGMIQGLYMDFVASREAAATSSAEPSDPSMDMDMSPTDVPNVPADQSTSTLSLFTAVPAPVEEEVAPVERVLATGAAPDVVLATSLRGRGPSATTVVEV